MGRSFLTGFKNLFWVIPWILSILKATRLRVALRLLADDDLVGMANGRLLTTHDPALTDDARLWRVVFCRLTHKAVSQHKGVLWEKSPLGIG